MKGRIMRVENGRFYVITEKGDFVSADAVDGLECGDEVEVKNEVMPSYLRPIASLAAAVIIVFGVIYGYHVPVRYVDVCINPEIQLSLNVIDRVVKVQGKNSDGRKIASAKKLKNEYVAEAIGEIVTSARTLGYMSNGRDSERDVIVSVFGSGADELSRKIPYDNVRIVDEDDCEMAKRQDIPVGKYVLINELAVIDSTQDVEKVKEMSVKQIIDKINDVKKADKPAVTPEPTAAPTAAPTQAPSEPEPAAAPSEQPIMNSAPIAEAIHRPTIVPAKTTVASRVKTSSAKASTSKSKPKTSTSKRTASTSSSKSNVKKSTPAPSVKPSSAPSPTAGILFPTEKPKATAVPSFDKVIRPPANSTSSSDKKNSDKSDKTDNSSNSGNGAVKPPKDNNSEQKNTPSGQDKPSVQKQESKPQTSGIQKESKTSSADNSHRPKTDITPKEQPKVSAARAEGAKQPSQQSGGQKGASDSVSKLAPSGGDRGGSPKGEKRQ